MKSPFLVLFLVLALILAGGCGAAFTVPPISNTFATAPPYLPSYYRLETLHAIWRKPVVSYHIGSGSSRLIDFRALIDTAVNHWKPALSPFLTFVEAPDEASADIVFNMVPQSDSILTDFISTSGGATIGNTDVQYDPITMTISHAICYISENQDPETIEATCTHEFFHALGAHIHSDNRQDVLYPEIHFPVVVTSRDGNTARSLYDSGVNPAP